MKDMDLDIPVFSTSSERLNLKPRLWMPDQVLHFQTTRNTSVTCYLCRGAGFVYVNSEGTNTVIKKYCLHCKGTREMMV